MNPGSKIKIMLSYKSALQLKKAGFSQWSESDYSLCPHTIGLKPFDSAVRQLHLSECKDIVSIPTLSELIEECGKRFYNLDRVIGVESDGKKLGDGFMVNNYDPGSGCIFGKTPEEAMKNLWLKLNTK